MDEQAPQEKPVLEPKRGLAEQIKAEHGEDVNRCYQCLKCSAGCPMTFAMDYPPSQIMRMVQLGQEDDLLASKTIWVCLTCNTCSIRCPNDIDIALVCMNLPYTMTVERAADAVLEFRPKQVLPYHYRGNPEVSDVSHFRALVEAGNPGIEVVQLDWYPGQPY